MALTMAEVARDYETDGVPSSGSHKIKKGDLRNWGAWVEGIINAFTANGGLIYSSKAALDADLAHAANTMAWVLGDATVANDGIYQKSGASGTGSWTRVSDLPFSFIIASDAGAGTANAIQATTSIPVSESALVWLNVFEANTASPVTVSFNGGSVLTIKTNAGNDVAVGGLTAGMIVLGVVSGATFRLVSDQASAAVLAACEAAQAAAEAAAASAGVSMASLGADSTGVVDCSSILDSAEATYNHIIVGPGTYLVDTERTWSDTVTYEFRGGGFVTGTDKKQTFNSIVKAGPRDNPFRGDLVQSAFQSGVTPPYVFGWQGSPKGDPATPYWFGAKGDGIWATDGVAVASDATFTSASASFTSADIGKTIIVKGAGAAGVDLETTIASINSSTSVELTAAPSTSVNPANYHFGTLDSDAIDCWLYFGKSMYLPTGNFFTNRDHGVKRSNVRIFGDGKSSVLHGAKGTSALLGLSGVGVGIQSGIVVENIGLDAGDVSAYNALGLTWVKDCSVRNIWARNCGHYPVTLQFECYNNLIDGVFVEDAATASGSTRAVISLEGTDTVFTDVDGNIIRNVHAESSGSNGIIVIHVKAVNTIENVLIDTITGDAATGLGILLRLREEVEQCVFKNIRAGSITGLLIAAAAEASNNVIEDVEAELITGAAGSSYGKIINILGNDNSVRRVRGYSSDADAADVATIGGARNKFFDCYFKGDTTGAILRVSGTDNEFYGQETIGLSVTTRVGNIDGARNKFVGGRTERPNNMQGLRFAGTDPLCDGMTVTGDGAGALRFEPEALRPIAVNNHLTGASATIDKFFASASTGVICNNRGDTQALNNFMLFGPYSIWVDATGDLRINNGAPATDTSGTVVGAQT